MTTASLVLSLMLSAGAWANPKFAPTPKITALPKVTKSVKSTVSKAKLTSTVNEDVIRIGILDSGYNADWTKVPIPLCETGHHNAMTGGSDISYSHWHGSVVASVIAEDLANKGVNYCAVIFQLVGPEGLTVESINEAVALATEQRLDAINLSLGGSEYSYLERRKLFEASKAGVKIFVAAGNDHQNLTKTCITYPACYPVKNLQVVGAMDDNFEYPAQYSNFGTKVGVWFPGGYQIGTERYDGTSFASPRALASYVYSLALQRAGK